MNMDFDIYNPLQSFVNDVEELNNFRAHTSTRRRKTYKARFDPMQDLTDSEFRQRYRFTKQNMCRIVDLLKLDLQVDTRGGGIPVELQVMAVIRYWGRHEIQEDCADVHGMSQQTLSRLACKVAIALASKSSHFIKMPSNMTEQANAISKFEAICGLQGIILLCFKTVHVETKVQQQQCIHDKIGIMEPYFGLKYKLERTENFDDLLIFLDIGFVQRQLAATLAPVQSVTKNDDGTYSIHFSSALVKYAVVFTPGVEFEEIKPDGVKVQALIVIEGNKITHIQREDNGRTLHHVFEFHPETMTITTTAEGLNKVVKRHFTLKK